MSDPFSGRTTRRTVEVVETPLAARLYEARIALDWTQEYAAKKVGVSRTQITNYERGHVPSMRAFVRLCDAYDVSADWLLWG